MGKLTGMLAELPASQMDICESAELIMRTMEAMAGTSEYPVIRVKVPSGESPAFFSMGDDAPPASEIEGVIMSAKYCNSYWDKSMDDGRAAPFCSSDNGMSGWYMENGELMERSCRTCKYNKMGSAEGDKKGKACKNFVKLLMLMDGLALPVEIKVPTMSINNFNMYIARTLAPRRLRINQVSTKLTLSKTANAKGTKYYQVQFECTGRVDESHIDQIMDAVAPMMLGAGVEEKADE